MKIDGNKITAEDGKIFRRKDTNDTFGEEIVLGYSYYINGIKLDTPHLDVVDDFEEIDSPRSIINEEDVSSDYITPTFNQLN